MTPPTNFTIDVNLPEKLQPLFKPARYKSIRGGRGGGKSEGVATYLLVEGMRQKHRFLCCREYMASMAASVIKVLSDKIDDLGLGWFYNVQKTSITGLNNTEFLFAGLHANLESIKSVKGVTKVWCEEAQSLSQTSIDILIPTIREEYSELIFTWNPDSEDDPVWKMFVVNPPAEGFIDIVINWQDNPFLPSVLDKERIRCEETDPDKADWVWAGNPRRVTEACIFRGKYSIHEWNEPEGIRPLLGVDWGFSTDPTVIVRCYIRDEQLWITHAEFGYQTELDDTPILFDRVPGSRKFPLKADCARPESISHLRRKGFNISAAAKWPNCIEERVEFLRSFRMIHIHSRCKQMQEEAKLYSFKVDKQNNQVLPLIVDKHNHGWDACAYALDGYIRRKGTSPEEWARLAG